jgi:hypothetical protein
MSEELTICIPGQCCRGYCVDDTLHDLTKDQADRVRDVVAARVQEYIGATAKRAVQMNTDMNASLAIQADLRADLAAANVRIADYERGIVWDTSCTSCAKVIENSHKEYERAERLADAVRRLADNLDNDAQHSAYPPRTLSKRIADSLRDALTTALAADTPTTATAEHEFLPVNGHPDDDECTHRSDGTDDTYCGLTRAEHPATAEGSDPHWFGRALCENCVPPTPEEPA